MHKLIISLAFIFALYCHHVSAQEPEVIGAFGRDTLKIGEEVSYTLTARYPRHLNVIFPDSSYNYGTFEFISKKYFPTRTDSTTSFDSVVYTLATFEIDTVQYLQLPVFVITENDSFAVFSNLDSTILQQVITKMPEKPELKANTRLVEIKKQINYPYILIALGIVIIMALVIIIFFGKAIARRWKLYRMNKMHKKFIERFYELMKQVSGSGPEEAAEHTLAEWKRYMEKLEKEPYSKLTTMEILAVHPESELKEHLHNIDLSIYGGKKDPDLLKDFGFLMQFAVRIFNEKVGEIKKG